MMTAWLLTRRKRISDPIAEVEFRQGRLRISVLLACFALLALLNAELFDLVKHTLKDVYLGVSIFVALTLALFYLLDRRFSWQVQRLLTRYQGFHVPIASVLGALPGCGGAIIVVTQFTNGQLRFGALVAVLISTMGDAAFLLLAKKPDIALLVYGISLIAGILFGYAVDLFDKTTCQPAQAIQPSAKISPSPLPNALTVGFYLLLVPGALLGIAEAFQLDTSAWFAERLPFDLTTWLGFIGALLCLVIWMSQPMSSWSSRLAEEAKSTRVAQTVVGETAFVTVWVCVGFLAFELLLYFTGLDLANLFHGLGGLAIALAVLIGFIPGCGPQIIVTTLYINGLVPLSAQLANAISNDGDALFPAIALAPNAAFKATLYSAIPAILIGYLTFHLGW